MKKWLILLVVVGLVAAGWYVARRQEFTPPWAQPKLGAITRGDIRVPISATGLIHANQVVEVKPKASGAILEVRAVEGKFVHDKDVLVVLDPVDEQRMLDRAKADFDRSQALLTQAEVAVERAKVNIENSKVHVTEVTAQLEMSRFEKDKMEAAQTSANTANAYSAQEVVNIRAQFAMGQAQRDAAAIAVRTAELALQDAQAAVKSQSATVEATRKSMEDAQQRLTETTIVAPREGIITQVFVKPGMLVQSGTQSLTGGTLLMALADVSSKEVIARLAEADYGRVLDISPVDALPEMPELRETARADAEQMQQRSGTVRITVDAFPDEVFEGRIDRVEPQGKLNSGASIIQFDVHVAITDAKRHQLPLGAQAQVEFTVESAIGVLRVPADAVKAVDEQRGVYIKTKPAAEQGDKWGMRFVPCRFGITDGEYTQLIGAVGDEKLDEGTQVYTKLPPKDTETN